MTIGRLVTRAVLILVVIFGGGWFLGGILNLAAIVSPALVSKVQCPAGAMSAQEFKTLSFNQPGEQTLTFQCYDASGKQVAPLSDAESRAIEYRIFYPAGVALMAVGVAIWYVSKAARARQRAGAGSAA